MQSSCNIRILYVYFTTTTTVFCSCTRDLLPNWYMISITYTTTMIVDHTENFTTCFILDYYIATGKLKKMKESSHYQINAREQSLKSLRFWYFILSCIFLYIYPLWYLHYSQIKVSKQNTISCFNNEDKKFNWVRLLSRPQNQFRILLEPRSNLSAFDNSGCRYDFLLRQRQHPQHLRECRYQ